MSPVAHGLPSRALAWHPTHRPPPRCARSYEEYLDSQITGTDMYFLEDVKVARELVELG